MRMRRRRRRRRKSNRRRQSRVATVLDVSYCNRICCPPARLRHCLSGTSADGSYDSGLGSTSACRRFLLALIRGPSEKPRGSINSVPQKLPLHVISLGGQFKGKHFHKKKKFEVKTVYNHSIEGEVISLGGLVIAIAPEALRQALLFTVYIVYCILHTVYCILYTVYCILYTVYRKLYTVVTVYSLLLTVYCIQFLHTVYCILYIVHCVLYSVYCILYTPYCIL